MSRSNDGLIWTDEIPLLEQIADFQGRPGGIAGLDYLYTPLACIMDMTALPPPTINPYTGRPIPPDRQLAWTWSQVASQVFRIIDSTTEATVDFQILARGEAMHHTCPGWYRVRTFVHPTIFTTLGWSASKAERLLGSPNDQPDAISVSVKENRVAQPKSVPISRTVGSTATPSNAQSNAQ